MASVSISACCNGCSVPSTWASPSTVVMVRLASFSMGHWQARRGLPSTRIVQAPQLASSQAYLHPVRCSTSRKYQSSGRLGSPVWTNSSPLMVMAMPGRGFTGLISLGGACSGLASCNGVLRQSAALSQTWPVCAEATGLSSTRAVPPCANLERIDLIAGANRSTLGLVVAIGIRG